MRYRVVAAQKRGGKRWESKWHSCRTNALVQAERWKERYDFRSLALQDELTRRDEPVPLPTDSESGHGDGAS
jgi:hypothetical protein